MVCVVGEIRLGLTCRMVVGRAVKPEPLVVTIKKEKYISVVEGLFAQSV